MTSGSSHEDFEPWAAPIEELAEVARDIESFADSPSRDLSTVEARRHFAAHILEVLKARATLEAARVQANATKRLATATKQAAELQADTADRIAKATEKQSRTANRLVVATWALVAATFVLAIVAVSFD